MKIKLKILIGTLALIAGFMVFAQGSRQIIKTYERESLYIETVKIGRHPVGSHADIVKQKGLKDGLRDIVLQGLGLAIVFAGGLYLARR